MEIISVSDILTLGLFVKTLTADNNYSLRNSESFLQQIEMQLSKNLNTFSQYFPQYQQSPSKFKHFEKKMSLLAYVFSKLKTVKCMGR